MKTLTEPPLQCGFCYPSERHGEVRREFSSEWMMFIPVCRKHSTERKWPAGRVATANEILEKIHGNDL